MKNMKRIFSIKQIFELNNLMLLNFIYLSEEEKEMIRNWRNNEKIRKWMYTDYIITIGEHHKFLENLKRDNKKYYWLVKNKKNEYLGTICFNKVDFKNKNGYFGIYSNPESKINGVGLLLDKLVIKIAFEIIKLHTLKLEVIEDNKQVIILHRMIGFQEEGRLKEFVFKDNKWKDVIIMGIINK